MDDPADVRFVDAHAEGDGGGDDAGGAVEERGGRVLPCPLRQARVVESHPFPGVPEDVAGLLRARVRRGVDDARAFEFGHRVREVLFLLADGERASRRQVDVGTVEVADDDPRFAQAE